MKAVGASFGVVLVVLLFVAALMGGKKDEQGSSSCTAPVGDSSGVPNGWGPAVNAAAKVAGMPASVLAAQLEAESGWNPKAASPVGAQGLGQFMPGTWATWGNGGDVFNPTDAIAAQGRFMGDLYKRAQTMTKTKTGDPVRLALAGYNAGWGAVEQYGGIPPFSETQNYVTKILANAGKYVGVGSSTATAAPVDNCSQAGPAGQGDDLPWKTAPIMTPSPLGMYNRECVDFALFRVNQSIGSGSAPYKITNSNFRGDGVLLGSANTPGAQSWLTGWQVKGWPTGTTPKVGAVVFYAPGVGGSDPGYGHVAVVKAVNSDGTYLEEGYNGNPAPNDHQYYTRIIKNSLPSQFLYVPAGAAGPEKPKNEGR